MVPKAWHSLVASVAHSWTQKCGRELTKLIEEQDHGPIVSQDVFPIGGVAKGTSK